MKRLASGVIKNLSSIILVAGAAAVAVGCGMLCLPAGLIAGGVLAMAGAVLSIWGEGSGEE